MADFPTQAELFRIARDEMLSRNGKLTLDTIETKGSDANILAAGMSAVGDEAVGQVIRVEQENFLDSAKKEALTRLVFDRYGITRKAASPAFGSVAFTTTIANPSAFSIPVGTRLQTADGKQFITIVAGTFPLGSTGPILVAVRSSLAGVSQQARIGTINSILDRPVGSPGDLVVTNTIATAGAADEESDEALVARARDFFVNARRGTASALIFAARSVPGVLTAAVFEELDSMGRPAHGTSIVISDAFTESLIDTSPTPPVYQTQSNVLAHSVFTALEEWRAAGVFVSVFIAAVSIQTIQLALRFFTNVDVDAVALEARAIVVNTVNALAPGEPLFPADLVTALRSVIGLDISGDEVLSPAGAVIPGALEVIRTTLGSVVAVSASPTFALQNSTNPDL